MQKLIISVILVCLILLLVFNNRSPYVSDSPVIYTIFAGRDFNLDILTKYLDKLIDSGKIQEVHLWDFTRKDSDSVYIRNLENTKEKYKVMHVENKGAWAEYYNHYKDPKYSDNIIIKSDDDIMFIDIDKFDDFIEARKKSDCWLMFPSIVNNGVTSFHQQQDGLIPESVYKLEYETFWGTVVTNGDVGKKLHEYFVNNKDEFLQKARANDKIIDIPIGDRTSINFFAMFGKDFQSLGQIDDDEHEITVEYPKVVQKRNTIYSSFVVAHGSFGSQKEKMSDEFVSGLYSKLLS